MVLIVSPFYTVDSSCLFEYEDFNFFSFSDVCFYCLEFSALTSFSAIIFFFLSLRFFFSRDDELPEEYRDELDLVFDPSLFLPRDFVPFFESLNSDPDSSSYSWTGKKLPLPYFFFFETYTGFANSDLPFDLLFRFSSVS
jgi:hypothetical protein